MIRSLSMFEYSKALKNRISYLIASILLLISPSLQGSGVADSIYQNESPATLNSSKKVNLLLENTLKFKKSDPVKATQLATEAYALCNGPELDTLKIKVLYQLADLYIDQGFYRLAIKYQLKGIQLAKDLSNPKAESDFWNQLGVSYDLAGMWNDAAKAYFNALPMYQKQQDSIGIAYIYNNLGLVKTNLNEYQGADSFFYLTLDLADKLNNESIKAMALSNLGLSANAQNKPKKALGYFQKTLDIDLQDSEPNNSYLGSDYNSIATCYTKLGEYAKAENLYQKALFYKSKSENKRGISSTYIQLAELRLQQKQAKGGLEFLDSAKNYAFSENNIPLLLEIYKVGSELYQVNNEPTKALSELKKYQSLQDSLNIVETAEKNLLLEKEYALERDAQQLADLEVAYQHQKEKRMFWMIAAIVLFVLAVLIFIQTRRLSHSKKSILAHQQQVEELNNNLKEKSEHLQEKHTALEKALSTKTRFLSVVSHEIRTPLHVVKGIAEILLSDDSLTEDQKSKIKVLLQSGNQLNKLVDEIFDLNNLESGHSDVRKESIQFKEWLEELFIPHKIQAEFKGLKAELNICKDIPDIVEVDPRKLQQVLDNLLSNAVKFTDAGEVSFKVDTIDKSAGQSTIRFSVSDSGIGMDDKVLQKVFEPFHQADFSMSRMKGGTGLGLSLSKGVLELMGGKIGVESNVGKGSTFHFDLVLKIKKTSTGEKDKDKKVKFIWPENKKLLIAEDHEQNVLILKMLMNRVHAQADWATNGLECYAKAMEDHYDLILMDLHMPIMDGKEAAQRIRNLANDRGESVKIIGLTAANESEVRELPDGLFDEVLYKPYRPDQLFRLMEDIVAN